MSWRDNLRPASFRGIPFEVDGDTAAFGRRNVEHEYPQRDTGAVEDMGRKLRRFNIQGYVLGDDWQARRDRLIEAAERGGPGRLVHPTYGTLEVNCDAIDVTTSSDAGRMVGIAFTFVEAGVLSFPTVEASSSAALADAAQAADAATAADFAQAFTVAGAPGFVLSAALEGLADRLAEVRRAIAGIGADELAELEAIAAAVEEIQLEAEALIQAPGELAARVVDALAGVGVLAVLDALTIHYGHVVPVQAPTPTAQRVEDNGAAMLRLFTRAGLAAAARVVSGSTFSSYDEAVDLRDKWADRLAAEAEAAADDGAFEAFTDLRLALVEDVELRAAELRRLATLELPAVSSTLELAASFYGDGRREAEIEARNLPPHPGFLTGSVVVIDA